MDEIRFDAPKNNHRNEKGKPFLLLFLRQNMQELINGFIQTGNPSIMIVNFSKNGTSID